MTRNKFLISTVTLAVAGLTGGMAVYAQGNYGSRTTNTVPDSTVGKTADTTFMTHDGRRSLFFYGSRSAGRPRASRPRASS